MTSSPSPGSPGSTERRPMAGGCLAAAAILAGAVIGIALGETTLGVLGGAVVGLGAALAVWLTDRSRKR